MYRFARAMMYVMRTLLQLPDQYLYAMPDARLGKMLLREVMLAGNFGQHDQRYVQLNSSNRLRDFGPRLGAMYHLCAITRARYCLMCRSVCGIMLGASYMAIYKGLA